MGGERITFRNLHVDCGREGVNAALFIAQGGSEASIPTDVVFEHGVLGPDAAHTILLANAMRSGARNTVICPGRTSTASDLVERGGAGRDRAMCASPTIHAAETQRSGVGRFAAKSL